MTYGFYQIHFSIVRDSPRAEAVEREGAAR